MQKMFTLEDLYNFYNNQGNSCCFNSHETNSTIIVQIPEKICFSGEYDPKYNLLPVHLLSCHLSENRNHSSISEKTMKEAIPSFYNRPILGYIQKIDDGNGNYHYDFAGHEMELSDDGSVEYKEHVVGIIPESCNPQLVYHEDNDKTYLEIDGYIFEDYTHAAEILREKGICDVSVELAVDQLSYSADTKILNIEQFHFMGVTILGVTTDESHTPIKPGMEGSNITIEDFSVENNSLTFNSNIINEIADAIVKKIGNAKTAERRNEPMDFEENIKEVTEETEVTEVMEETTEEETPVVETEASKEVVEEAVEETPEVVEENFEDEESAEKLEDEEVVEDVEEETEDEQEEVEDTSEEFEEETEEEETVVDDDEQEPGYGKQTFSVNGITFETSLSEIQWAVSELVNNTYSESDNDYYSVEVYESSKTVVMIGWCTGRAYKQSYKVRNGVYSLVGDRVNVKAVYVTADEEAELDKMRNNYSAISDKLAKYESEPEKMNVLNSSDYANIADHADFAELKKQENHFDLTVDELKEKADAMLLAYAKSGKLNFAATESEQEAAPKKDFFAFARFEQDTSFLDRVLKEKR